MNNTEQELVVDSYNKIASNFATRRCYTWTWIDSFMTNCTYDSNILDIGCGSGRNLNYKNYNMFGIDSSIEQLKQCKNKNTILGDMTDLPYQSCSFDYILSIASLHHLSNEERRIQAINEMYRVLKYGGQVLLSVWSINQPDKTRRKFDKYGNIIVNWKNIPRYYYIFRINELYNLFEQCQFEIIIHKWDCGNEIFILQKNYKERR